MGMTFQIRKTAPVLLGIAAATTAAAAAVTYPGRARHYEIIADGAAGSALHDAVGLVASYGLVALVALAAVIGAGSLLASRRRFWTLASAGVGVVAAYALSELIKILVAEDRPCTSGTVSTVLACPGAGDWSWPSNHSVLAGAFASACILTVTRSAWIATPLALLIAGSRVAAGVHYPHDVLSGLTLGGVVVVLVVVALRPVTDRAASRTNSLAPRGSRGAPVQAPPQAVPTAT